MSIHSEQRQKLFAYFKECVNRHFEFLKNMSYSTTENTTGWSVSYASDKVELEICYERISFEIYLTVSLNRSFQCSVDEILPHNFKRKILFATDETMIENAVLELKTLITNYGNPFLMGDATAFSSISEQREKKLKNYELGLLERKAIAAWESANYEEVVLLYQAMKEHLNPIQEKRLYLSLKKCNPAPAYHAKKRIF